MIYKHILVAVDLTKSSEIVINKALLLAKETNARLSFIYVDANYISLSGPLSSSGAARPDDDKEKQRLHKDLQVLVNQLDYPVENTLVVMGDVEEKLSATVNQIDADLLVCGHHHDFWSRILSSVRKLVNIVNTDLLIVYIDK